MAGSPLLIKLREMLRKNGDPQKAAAMQAYMKSPMPYHGVPAPALRKICKNAFAGVQFEDRKDWENQILVLWRNARFREERYAALSLARARSAREFQTLPAMKIYEEMIVTGAWWDYVDDIASHHVGFILNKYPVQMRRKMLAWSKCPNLWKRRTAIICQLGRKHETDLSLLYSCIEPSLDSREFFLQKAIGWALRQYAWTDPQEVRRYVKEKSGRLSALSRKEALRNIGADK